MKEIIRCFSVDINATKTTELTEISGNTINKYFDRFRKIIALSMQGLNAKELGEYELDESYFGAKRVKGVRGRGALSKTPVF